MAQVRHRRHRRRPAGPTLTCIEADRIWISFRTPILVRTCCFTLTVHCDNCCAGGPEIAEYAATLLLNVPAYPLRRQMQLCRETARNGVARNGVEPILVQYRPEILADRKSSLGELENGKHLFCNRQLSMQSSHSARNFFALIAIAIAALALMSACTTSELQTDATDSAEPPLEPLVTAQWLSEHLDDPNLVILDCTVVVEPDESGGMRIREWPGKLRRWPYTVRRFRRSDGRSVRPGQSS